MYVTKDQLLAIAPLAPKKDLDAILRGLNDTCEEFQIDTPARIWAFLSQLLHESGQFRFREEIWGPTEAQRRYEGRRDLGNVHPGDGFRFRGRGYLQLTGRANYRTYGKRLHLPLEANPNLAAGVEASFRIAGLYWKLRGINKRADRHDLTAVTRAVNGGLNGYADRERYYYKAKAVITSLPVQAVRRAWLDGDEVTGRRIAAPDGRVVNATDPSRIYIYVPGARAPRPSNGRYPSRVFLNAVEVTGQSFLLPDGGRLNAEIVGKVFLEGPKGD